MPEKENSIVYDVLNRFVEHWDNIFVRSKQSGTYQSISLIDIKDDKEIADFVIKVIKEKFE